MARKPATGFRNRRTQFVAISGALVVLASLALPKLMAPAGDAPQVLERKGRKQPPQQHTALLRDRVPPPAVTTGSSATTTRAQPTRVGADAQRVEVERVVRAADDLDIALSLRWASYPTGTKIQAQVEIANCDESPVWIPAAGEPQPTLAIRVLDANGVTVRHVVEDTSDGMPHRMRRLGPGETATIDLDVIAHGETPLEPGRYELAAFYEADKDWLRTGLPVWSAPKGARHSGRVPFEVTAR